MGDDGRNTTEKTWSDNLSPQKKRKVEVVTSLNAATTAPATTGKAAAAAAQKDEENKAAAIPKNHEDAQAAAAVGSISLDYCATDLIPFFGIASIDFPLPDNVFSNDSNILFQTNIPIESFPRPDNVFSEFESAAIAKTLNN